MFINAEIKPKKGGIFLKITKVEPIMTGWRRMFVKVYTDEGIVGVGEGGNWGFR